MYDPNNLPLNKIGRHSPMIPRVIAFELVVPFEPIEVFRHMDPILAPFDLISPHRNDPLANVHFGIDGLHGHDNITFF
jgi:hypothetical protein